MFYFFEIIGLLGKIILCAILGAGSGLIPAGIVFVFWKILQVIVASFGHVLLPIPFVVYAIIIGIAGLPLFFMSISWWILNK